MSAGGDAVISPGSRWLWYVFGLPFLKPSEARDAFLNDLLPIRPQCPKLIKFTEYLFANYLNDDALFPPTLWACETGDLMARTTNTCESFHSRFNASFYKDHPDIFLFTRNLIQFQTETYVTIQSLNTVKKVRSTYTRKKLYVENLMADYRNKAIDRLQFIKRLGYYLSPE